MSSLLEKTRTVNRLALKSIGKTPDFSYVAEVLTDILEASAYILDKEGIILGYSYQKGLICDVIKDITEERGIFPSSFNDRLNIITETFANYTQIENSCVFSEKSCFYSNKTVTMIPIVGPGARFGTLVLARLDKHFTDEDLILGECAATVIALELIRANSKKKEEEARKRAAVQIALATLSYSELDAIQNIFEVLGGDEGLLVASRIADRVGITRSVIVNALRKFESAGIIESRSLEMKGTYIRILNEHLQKELEKLNSLKR